MPELGEKEANAAKSKLSAKPTYLIFYAGWRR